MSTFKDKEASKSDQDLGDLLLKYVAYVLGKPYGDFVDFCDAAGAIIEVCGGTADHRSGLAFQLYDYEMKGEISKHELRLYLHSIYTFAFCTVPKLGDKYDVEMMVNVSSEIALKESKDPRVITMSEFDKFYCTGLLNWTDKDLSEENLLRIENECKFMKRRGRTTTRSSRSRDRSRSRSRSRSNSPDSRSGDMTTDGSSSLSHRALFYALKGLDSPSDARKRLHREVHSISKSLESLSISKASSASMRSQ